MTDLARVASALATARSVFVLTGSGISSESGLPTFRGVDGLWRTHRVEVLASAAGFARDPELVWTWYNERRAAHLAAEPNAGHRALAELQARIHDMTLATQNVDSLHARAGSRDVLELHGSLREARCDRCGARRTLDRALDRSEIGHACGGRFRPDIVWFGESLPANVFERAARAAARADVVLVIGTSGMVNPAASLATLAPKPDALVVEVNPDETAITPRADVAIRDRAARALPALLETVVSGDVSERVT
jgi:NAD-dependent deacetylase